MATSIPKLIGISQDDTGDSYYNWSNGMTTKTLTPPGLVVPKGSDFSVPDALAKSSAWQGINAENRGGLNDIYTSINSGAYQVGNNMLYTKQGSYELQPTGQDNVYVAHSPNVNGSSYKIPIAVDMNQGKAAMPDSFVNYVQYSGGPGGGWLGGLKNGLQTMGPLANIALAALTGGLSLPEQIAAQTALGVAKGQDLGTALTQGALSAGAASLFGGSSVPDAMGTPQGLSAYESALPTDSSFPSQLGPAPTLPPGPSYVPELGPNPPLLNNVPELGPNPSPFEYTPQQAPSNIIPETNGPATSFPVPDQSSITSTPLPPTDTLPISAQDPFAYTPTEAPSNIIPETNGPTADMTQPISAQDPFAEPTPEQLNPPTTPSTTTGSDLYKLAGKTPYEPGLSATPGAGTDLVASTPAEGLQAGPNANLADMGGGQGLTAAGAGGIGSISAAGLDSGLLTGAGLAGGLGVGLSKTAADVASALSKVGIDPATGNIVGPVGGTPGIPPTGSGGGSNLTGMGALAGGLGLAGLLALMNSDSSRFGTPGRASYSGPLNQYKFNPSTYQASTPNPAMFRPTGVTTVADQVAAQRQMAPMQSPFAAMPVRQDPVNFLEQLAGPGFAKGGTTKPQYTSKGKLAAMDPWSRAAAEYQNNAYMAQMPVAPTSAPAVPALGQLNLSGGGQLGSYSDGGHMLKGPGDGMSDSIPATIGGKRPARLADGEFVVPADVVSHLGNGSTEAGARELYRMMDKVRQARTGRKAQGKQINPGKFMPK